MTTKYINGSGLSKLLQLISISVGQVLNSISNKLSNIDSTHANLVEVTYDELVKLRSSNDLIPGQYYRITDYITTTSQENTMSNGSIRQIIVLATDYDTLSEEAMTDDGCKVWYCLDNDTDRFAWAGATKKNSSLYLSFSFGTGHWMRNEDLDLEISDITYYGYKWQVGFSGDALNRYTAIWFTQEYVSEISDPIDTTCFYMSEGENEMIPLDVKINSIIPNDVAIGKGVIYRMIDKNGNDCPYDFKSIMFKNPNDNTDPNYYYTFTNISGTNYIDYIDISSVQGAEQRCTNNVINAYYQNSGMYDKIMILNNIIFISYRCSCNTFGHNCYNNIFNASGGASYNNTFGLNCYNNTFGLNCTNNTFGDNCYNNTFGNKFSNNTFGNKCNYIQMINTNDGTSKYVSYYNITSGISGKSSDPLIITGETDRNFETKVARNSSGEIKIYCEADLVV